MSSTLSYGLLSARTYGHFPAPALKDCNFFYLGKSFAKLALLAKSFGNGFHCEKAETAVYYLNQFMQQTGSDKIVVIDGQTPESLLMEVDRAIPSFAYAGESLFLLDASGLALQKIKDYKRFRYLQESFILTEQNADRLVSQISFLKKMKKQSPDQIQVPLFSKADSWSDANRISKRAFDILLSALVVILLSPLFLLIAIAVKIDSAGPAFYISKRAGRGYKVFNFYKFRTMIEKADQQVDQLDHLNQYEAEEAGPRFFKIEGDPRCTRAGLFLRATSLDELPQLFNVLLGDMSLVGNRPLPLNEAATLTTDQWAARFMAPAGITGLWQIKKKHVNNMSVEDRINLDIIYARKHNVIYDMWILANTPTAMLQKSRS